MVSAKLLVLLPFLSLSAAAPIPSFVNDIKTGLGFNGINNKQDPTLLATTDISSKFTSVAQFARTAYCSPAAVTSWKCGDACHANAGTQVIRAGGDGGITPQYFVAFNPASNAVIVAHEGTKKDNPLSDLNDIEFALIDAPAERFPGANAAGAKVHSGFLATFNRTIDQILPSVQQTIQDKGATKVIVTGHSLGAAVAMLDAIFLRSHLDPKIKVEATLFGLPRTGNPAWATYVEKTMANDSFQFFVNGADPVPKVPPTNLGFQHPAGEIFQKNGTQLQVFDCPGAENENCSASISLLKGKISSHKGPYAGVSMGGSFCTA